MSERVSSSKESAKENNILQADCLGADLAKHELARLFNPASIAHVGASAKDAPGRFNFIDYLQKMGYAGKLYPVNPSYPEIRGLKCYPDLAAIPGDIDLVILALPAKICAQILKQVPAGKLKFVIVHTSGFSEIDKHGLEDELVDLARKKGFRIIGPNCMGVFSQQSKVCFWEDQNEFADRPGSVGFISQSGGIAIYTISGSIDVGINIDKAISLGNQIDLSINELLEFMGRDESIKIVSVYVEDVKDGREFLKQVRNITPHKPVVVWKGGRTEVGKAAAKTHTGSMAGDTEVFASAMRQAGAIMVDNIEQLLSVLRVLQSPFPLPGRNLGIICAGGGNTVNISDSFSEQPDLVLPRLSRESLEALKKLLPEENVDIKNPVDPGAVGVTKMDKIIKVMGEDPLTESIVVMLPDEILFHFKNENTRAMIADMLSSLIATSARQIGKPVYAHVMHIRDNHEEVFHCRKLLIDKLNEKQIPWVDGSFENAGTIFSRLAGYSKYLKAIE